MSIASSIGTPAAIRPEKVREKRARATFWTMSPIFIGNFSLIRSHCMRPRSEFFQKRNTQTTPAVTAIITYQRPVIMCDSHTVNLVMAGSSPPKSLKIFSNTGTRKATRANSTTKAKPPISDGYIIAALIWRRSAASFSSWVGDPDQRLVQDAAGLAGLDHRHVEVVEDLGVAAQRVGEREARLHVLAHLDPDVAQLVVLGLLLDHVQRAQQRHAGLHHRRQLARGDHELVGLDALEAGEDVARVGGLLLLDVDDDQALGAQLRAPRPACRSPRSRPWWTSPRGRAP